MQKNEAAIERIKIRHCLIEVFSHVPCEEKKTLIKTEQICNLDPEVRPHEKSYLFQDQPQTLRQRHQDSEHVSLAPRLLGFQTAKAHKGSHKDIGTF